MDQYYNHNRDDAQYNQHPGRQNPPSSHYQQQQYSDPRASPPPPPPPLHSAPDPDLISNRTQPGSRDRNNDQYDQYEGGFRPGDRFFNNRPPGPGGYAAAHGIVTPNSDNFGNEASGGVAGIAYTVAAHNARDSGMDAMYDPSASGLRHPQQANASPSSYGQESDSYSSGAPLARGGSSTPARAETPGRHSPYGTPLPFAAGYGDDPYQRTSQTNLGIDPDSIADDGDDGLGPARPQRHSWLSQGNRGKTTAAAATAATAAAVGGGGGAGAAGLNALSRAGGDGGGSYGPVGANTQYQGPAGFAEKFDVAQKNPSRGRTLRKWIIFGIITAIIVGVVLGLLAATHVIGGGSSSGADDGGSGARSAADDARDNGDLNINSAEIKALMGNPDLHKVFFGMDYTPINTQYPDCLHNPPSQNNVTRDIAVISQLTNRVRLYGTDCNQTEMVIHAIQQLQLEDTMKVWMGVWQDGNDTTNDRQLSQMWTVLDTYGQEPFAGLIVANEILFREQMTASTLGQLLNSVRSNLTSNNWDLTVSTSDLGDDWNSSINQTSDHIMANIHPFFAGADAASAASWTMGFWTGVDGQWFRSDTNKNIIAETGWPSKGGQNCGVDTVTTCAHPAVAGVDELNTFLEDWVCPALQNGTQYFWFSMFDEPWKISYNEPEKGKEWEDQWGLMDVNRKLKDGVKIPDCGGMTV